WEEHCMLPLGRKSRTRFRCDEFPQFFLNQPPPLPGASPTYAWRPPAAHLQQAGARRAREARLPAVPHRRGHWTNEDIEREKRVLHAPSHDPTIVLKDSFSELLDNVC